MLCRQSSRPTFAFSSFPRLRIKPGGMQSVVSKKVTSHWSTCAKNVLTPL